MQADVKQDLFFFQARPPARVGFCQNDFQDPGVGVNPILTRTMLHTEGCPVKLAKKPDLWRGRGHKHPGADGPAYLDI